MFLGVLLKEGSYFHLLFEKLLENEPKTTYVLLPKNPRNLIIFCQLDIK